MLVLDISGDVIHAIGPAEVNGKWQVGVAPGRS